MTKVRFRALQGDRDASPGGCKYPGFILLALLLAAGPVLGQGTISSPFSWTLPFCSAAESWLGSPPTCTDVATQAELEGSVGVHSDVDLTGVLTGHLLVWDGADLVASGGSGPGVLAGPSPTAVAGITSANDTYLHQFAGAGIVPPGGAFDKTAAVFAQNLCDEATADIVCEGARLGDVSTSASTNDINAMHGVYGYSVHQGSGAVVTAEGVWGSFRNYGSGVVSRGLGVGGQVMAAGGTTTDGQGFISECIQSGAGVLTNCVGYFARGVQTGTSGTLVGFAVEDLDNASGAATGLLIGGKVPAGSYAIDSVVTLPSRLNGDLRLNAHVASTGTSPTVSACGTTPAIVGGDLAGKVTIGTGATTSCTLTFAVAYSAAPSCTVTGEDPAIGIGATTTTTALTITSSADMTGDVLMYHCIGTSA